MKFTEVWRLNIIGAAFAFLGFAVIAQSVRIQVSPQADLFRAQIEDWVGYEEEVTPPRGLIYDRTGNLLAGNKTVFAVNVELRLVEDPEGLALVLNSVLHEEFPQFDYVLDYNWILNLVSEEVEDTNPKTVTIKSNVPEEEVDILRDYIRQWEDAVENGDPISFDLSGLVFEPQPARAYPEGELASTILGFLGFDGLPYYGVEQYYQQRLSGMPQEVWFPNDPNLVTESPDIPPGTSLVLTIDREIQAMVEEELLAALDLYDAEAGTVVIMDPETGEILAMASTPSMDLNEFWRFETLYPYDKDEGIITPFNRAISRAFEPGSVFKIFTMAAGLDSGTVERDTTFVDTGEFEIGGITIKNWDESAWGQQSMIGCLQHSLNVCLSWVGAEMGADTFYAYMNAFGFGHFTGIDIAGEASGRLKTPGDSDWWPADLGANTFGQGISVTPVQIIQAASALANEGQMVVPHVVLSFVTESSQYDIRTQVAGQPISAESAATITDMLAISLEEEASVALVPGYRIAGKTGTAEIPTEDGYTRDITNASFIGYGPADDPQFLVYVWLEAPQESIWGSQTAAPAFAQIVQRLVVLMNIPPDNVRLGMTTTP